MTGIIPARCFSENVSGVNQRVASVALRIQLHKMKAAYKYVGFDGVQPVEHAAVRTAADENALFVFFYKQTLFVKTMHIMVTKEMKV